MEYQDYYKILGVKKDATDAELKKAYRRLARKYHPDVSKEKNAEAEFKKVNEAYEVLKDKEKRQMYDQLGPNWKDGQGFGGQPGGNPFGGSGGAGGFGGFSGGQSAGGFSDFFESMFGGGGFGGAGAGGFGGGQRQQQRPQQPRGRKGEDITTQLSIDIEDAYHGSSKTINLRMPEKNQFGHTEMKLTNFNVKIPKGIAEGKKIRLKGKGGPAVGIAEPGDLYLEVHYKKSSKYQVDGHDIIYTLPITPWEAALGAAIPVETIVGKVNVKVPPNSQSGKKLRMKGKGMPGKKPGDFYYQLIIMNPPVKSDEDKKLFESLAEKCEFNPRI